MDQSRVEMCFECGPASPGPLTLCFTTHLTIPVLLFSSLRSGLAHVLFLFDSLATVVLLSCHCCAAHMPEHERHAGGV